MNTTMMPMTIIRACVVVSSALLLFGLATCDIDQDKERCANKLIGAATCLPYVSDEATAPPMDCCASFNQIVASSPECVCLLVKDRDDPSLGLKINATRALGLPVRCRSPVNLTVSDCPGLLHLSPNSPDAKVFQDFANSAKNSTTSAAAKGTPSQANTTAATANPSMSDGGKKTTYIGSQVLVAVVAGLLNL